jgi:hypothetical protein
VELEEDDDELDDELAEEDADDDELDDEDAEDDELPKPLEDELEVCPDEEDEEEVSAFPPVPSCPGPRVVPSAQANMTSGTEITRTGRMWWYCMHAWYSPDLRRDGENRRSTISW